MADQPPPPRYPKNSIYTKVHTLLTDHGLWPNEATQVMNKMIANPEQKAMKLHWNNKPSAVPAIITKLAFAAATREAVKWIDENAPLHFARDLLVDEQPSIPQPTSKTISPDQLNS